jgi:hypothetical protein
MQRITTLVRIRSIATLWVMSVLLFALQDAGAQRPDPEQEAFIADANNDQQREAAGLAAPAVPAAFGASVRRAELLGAALHDALRTDPATWSPVALRARDTAERAALARCDHASYRTLVFADPGAPDTQLVYLLGTSERADQILIGRHFKVAISADGSAVLSTQASTVSCWTVPASREKDSTYFVHAPLGCSPTEFHVLLSRTHERRLYVRTSVGSWKVDPMGKVTFISATAALCRDTRATDAENRWVAFGSTDPYAVALVYLDPQAGFTMDVAGRTSLDQEGQPRPLTAATPTRGASLKIRMLGNPWVHVLSDEWLARLKLEKVPAWLAAYADRSDPVSQKVHRASAYNGIGEPAAALALLESSPADVVARPGGAYELAFALNALQKFDRAIETASPVLQREPRNWQVCKELAFAFAHGGRPLDAVRQYQDCMAIVPEGGKEVRSEMAFNLAGVYRGLGEPAQCLEWLARAREWAPERGQERQMLERAMAAPGPCG